MGKYRQYKFTETRVSNVFIYIDEIADGDVEEDIYQKIWDSRDNYDYDVASSNIELMGEYDEE